MTVLWETYKQSLSDGSAYDSAVAILELLPQNPVLQEAMEQVRTDDYRPPTLDWDAWIDSVERHGRGWSSGEWRLYDLAAALAGDRPVKLRGTLDSLGDLLQPVMHILYRWGAINY